MSLFSVGQVTNPASDPKQWCVGWIAACEIFGLMAGLIDEPILGTNDIIETREEAEIKDVLIDKVREEGGQGDREMAPPTGNSIHRSGSRPQLDLSKAAILGNSEERDPTILLPNQSDDISHLALDIGGTTYNSAL